MLLFSWLSKKRLSGEGFLILTSWADFEVKCQQSLVPDSTLICLFWPWSCRVSQGQSSGDSRVKKKYIVRLTEQERSFLKDVVKKGRGPAYKIKHANILLNIDADGPNWTDTQAAEAFSCMRNTVSNRRYWKYKSHIYFIQRDL